MINHPDGQECEGYNILRRHPQLTDFTAQDLYLLADATAQKVYMSQCHNSVENHSTKYVHVHENFNANII